MSSKLPPRLPPAQQDLLRAAQRLAQQGELDPAERAVVERAADGGVDAGPQLVGIVDRHRDALSVDQRQALQTVLGEVPTRGKVLDFSAHLARHRAGALAGPTDGPQLALSERRVLEDLLQRHGPSLDGQLRNLVVGFLRTLPEEGEAPRRGQLGALAQIVALRAEAKPLARTLDVDPEQTPVPRADLEAMLDANASRGHLLVALGAATPAEFEQYERGEMTLGQFYRLAARGHFGDQVDQPVSYQALRDRMSSAGLEIDFHRLLGDLDPADSERLLDGQLTPGAIFSLLAASRGRPA